MSVPDEEADVDGVDGVTRTVAGDVRGVEEDGIWVFKGIPYAGDPSGPRRWRRPEPTTAWAGVRDAIDFGPIAPQPPPVPGMSIPGDPSDASEGCLNLNVWTPGIDDGARPVLVWIHGGGFTSGSGSSFLYRGDRLSRKGDVVVVTLNYRLGALGFLAHPSLAESGGQWGNWGLFDQLAALEWVRDNIAYFGGNPENVTVFGESAGAMSICSLLGSPAANGLFHGAIIQSGPPACSSEAWAVRRSVEFSTKVDARFTAGANFDARDLADVSPMDLVAAAQRVEHDVGGLPVPFLPVVGGGVLDLSPPDAARKNVGPRVPVIIGTNRDECSFFALGDLGAHRLNDEVLRRRVSVVVESDFVDPIIDAYRSARTDRGERTDPLALWTAITTDLVFCIPSISFADVLSSSGADVYTYLFTWESPFFDGVLGSTHAIEIPFVFGTVANEAVQPYTGHGETVMDLSDAVMRGWIAFARDRNPSCDELGEWPTYRESRPTMVLGEKRGVQEDPREAERLMWSATGVDMANRLFQS
ncbi:MAG: carboxylesterase family protein [Acidimicrobiales bacterium]